MRQRTLGKYVNEHRLKNNLSLRDLANKTDLSYSYIHAIEKDKVKPSREVITALSEGLKGALPDEMLRLGGLLPEQTVKEEAPVSIHIEKFTQRFNECLDKGGWAIEVLAIKTNVDELQLRRWSRLSTYRTMTDKLPGILDVYKLANVFEVTPDYLAGFADEPEDYHPAAPRPKNLRNILASEALVFDHIPLDKQAKEKLSKLIVTVFGS